MYQRIFKCPCCNLLNSLSCGLSVAVNDQICSSSLSTLLCFTTFWLLALDPLALVMCRTHWILNPAALIRTREKKQHINFNLFPVLEPIWVARDSCCSDGQSLHPIGFTWDYLWEIRLMWHPRAVLGCSWSCCHLFWIMRVKIPYAAMCYSRSDI